MANHRKDGLSNECAMDTVLYICRKNGFAVERMGESVVTTVGSLGVQTAESLRACLGDAHGFGITVTGDGDAQLMTIDVTTCPDDATQEERERLAEAEAARWEESADQELSDAGESAFAVLSRSTEAGNQQHSWCMQQTIVFLRRRAASEKDAASAATPAT